MSFEDEGWLASPTRLKEIRRSNRIRLLLWCASIALLATWLVCK